MNEKITIADLEKKCGEKLAKGCLFTEDHTCKYCPIFWAIETLYDKTEKE